MHLTFPPGPVSISPFFGVQKERAQLTIRLEYRQANLKNYVQG